MNHNQLRKPEHCWYCERPLSAPRTHQHPSSLTKDHVYPQTLKPSEYPPGLYTGHSPLVNQPTPRNHPRNRVLCCFSCNQQKGSLHPVSWLTLINNENGATRLSALLLGLGEDPAKVARAMAARNVRLNDG